MEKPKPNYRPRNPCHKECKKCNKRFKPTGRFQRVCKDCWLKIRKGTKKKDTRPLYMREGPLTNGDSP